MVTFNAQANDPSATFSWTLPSSASVGSAQGVSVPNVTFNAAGFQTVILEAQTNFCQATFTDSILIFGDPIADFIVPPQVECLGYTITFTNSSQNTFNYSWDFGFGQSSIQTSPTVTFPSPGLYTVTLISASTGSCTDTISTLVPIGEPILLDMTHSDSLCIDNAFAFDAQVSGPAGTQYFWNFGPNANPQQSTQLTGNQVYFLQNGFQQVQLIGQNPLCTDTLTELVRVFGHPSIDFVFIESLQCAPSIAQFVNLSQTEVPTSFIWDFGDGNTSQVLHPNHVYTTPGNYTVTLTLQEQAGCLDTLFMAQQDLITVHPSPQAGFIVNPDEVDVCNNEVNFTSQAISAVSYTYFVEDKGFTYNVPNFVHAYQTGGTDFPMQVVANAFGCTDTAYARVEVAPFSIYAPNTFIPDNNDRNDVFYVVTDFEVFECSLKIFNRWGEVVFESNNLVQGWDGTYKGLACQDGQYNYVLKFKPCHEPNIMRQYEGIVHLLR
jgi:gliding motility-associated-like protein